MKRCLHVLDLLLLLISNHPRTKQLHFTSFSSRQNSTTMSLNTFKGCLVRKDVRAGQKACFKEQKARLELLMFLIIIIIQMGQLNSNKIYYPDWK